MNYGCEIWGSCNWDQIENLHLFICKYALGVKRSTPNERGCTVLGRFPLLIIRKIQIIKFANRVWSLDDKKLVMKVQILDDVKGRFN